MIDNKFLAEKYGLNKSHFWKPNQSGLWIISHVAVMIIADYEGIEFSKPEYIEKEMGSVVLLGSGEIILENGDKKVKWTHGEANLKNCRVPYPYAMAEKRLKDRLTLMLISAYGDVYSEIEADEFAARQQIHDE